ncbi:hypothetical protein HN51_015851, partial [Arachis hypogaea]
LPTYKRLHCTNEFRTIFTFSGFYYCLLQEMGFAFHKGWKKMLLAADSAEERME